MPGVLILQAGRWLTEEKHTICSFLSFYLSASGQNENGSTSFISRPPVSYANPLKTGRLSRAAVSLRVALINKPVRALPCYMSRLLLLPQCFGRAASHSRRLEAETTISQEHVKHAADLSWFKGTNGSFGFHLNRQQRWQELKGGTAEGGFWLWLRGADGTFVDGQTDKSVVGSRRC